MSSNSKLVYSTDKGRIDQQEKTIAKPPTDGKVRVKKETKGRKGKGVCIIEGLDLDVKELKILTKKLKQVCGTGGTLKGHIIEIQGDQRDKIIECLSKQNIKAIKAGG